MDPTNSVRVSVQRREAPPNAGYDKDLKFKGTFAEMPVKGKSFAKGTFAEMPAKKSPEKGTFAQMPSKRRSIAEEDPKALSVKRTSPKVVSVKRESVKVASVKDEPKVASVKRESVKVASIKKSVKAASVKKSSRRASNPETEVQETKSVTTKSPTRKPIEGAVDIATDEGPMDEPKRPKRPNKPKDEDKREEKPSEVQEVGSIQIDNNESVDSLIQAIADKTNVNRSNLRLFYRGKSIEALRQSESIKSQGIQNNSEITGYITSVAGGSKPAVYIQGGSLVTIKFKLFKRGNFSNTASGMPPCIEEAIRYLDEGKKPEDLSKLTCDDWTISGTQKDILVDYAKSNDDQALCIAIEKENNFVCTEWAYLITSYVTTFMYFIGRVDRTLDKLIEDYKKLREASRDVQLTDRQRQFFTNQVSESATNLVTIIEFHKAWQDTMKPWIEQSNAQRGRSNSLPGEYNKWPSDVSKIFQGTALSWLGPSSAFAKLPSANQIRSDPTEYWKMQNDSTKLFVDLINDEQKKLTIDAFVNASNIDANLTQVQVALKALALEKKDSSLEICDPFDQEQRIATLRIDEFYSVIGGVVTFFGDANAILRDIVQCMVSRIQQFNAKHPTSQISIRDLPVTDVTQAVQEYMSLVGTLKRKLKVI